MSRYTELEDRFDRLVEALGLIEYRALEEIKYYDFEDGILQDISGEKDRRIKYVHEDMVALTDYLGVTLVDVAEHREVVKIKKDAAVSAQSRKYVKSGKYSKKGKR